MCKLQHRGVSAAIPHVSNHAYRPHGTHARTHTPVVPSAHELSPRRTAARQFLVCFPTGKCVLHLPPRRRFVLALDDLVCRSSCYVATTAPQQPAAVDFASVKYPVLRAAGYHLVTKVADVTVVPYQRSSHGDPFCPVPPLASSLRGGRATSLSGLLCHSLPTHPSVLIVLPLHHSPTTPYRISQSSGAHHGCVTHHSREKTPPSGGTHGKSLGLINIPHMPVHRASAFLPAYLPGPAVLRLRARRRGGIPEWRLGRADRTHRPGRNPQGSVLLGADLLAATNRVGRVKSQFCSSPTTIRTSELPGQLGATSAGIFRGCWSANCLSCLSCLSRLDSSELSDVFFWASTCPFRRPVTPFQVNKKAVWLLQARLTSGNLGTGRILFSYSISVSNLYHLSHADDANPLSFSFESRLTRFSA